MSDVEQFFLDAWQPKSWSNVLFALTSVRSMAHSSLLCAVDWVIVRCGLAWALRLASKGSKALAIKVRAHKAFAPNAVVQEDWNIVGHTSARQEAGQTRLVKGCMQHFDFWLRTPVQK